MASTEQKIGPAQLLAHDREHARGLRNTEVEQ